MNLKIEGADPHHKILVDAHYTEVIKVSISKFKYLLSMFERKIITKLT